MNLELDHLIYAGPDLEQLATDLGRLTGRPTTPGGSHDGFGTRNHIVASGSGTYLELMAPDPAQDGGPFANAIAPLTMPSLHAWCVRTNDMQAVANALKPLGIDVVTLAMQRQQADGSTVAWTSGFPAGDVLPALAPFFIEWQGDSPASALDANVTLRELALLTPDPQPITGLLDALGGIGGAVHVTVETHHVPGLRAAYVGPRGPFALRGAGYGMPAPRFD